MKVLVVGAGGVGSAAVGIAARRAFFEPMVVADYDLGRAERAIAADARTAASWPRRSTPPSLDAVAALCREHGSRTCSTRSTRAS